MKTILLVGALTIGVLLVGQRAECVWCPPQKCWTSDQCLQCVCLTRDYTGGVCVAVLP